MRQDPLHFPRAGQLYRRLCSVAIVIDVSGSIWGNPFASGLVVDAERRSTLSLTCDAMVIIWGSEAYGGVPVPPREGPVGGRCGGDRYRAFVSR